ncbi:hypothetical protein APHAL10511_000489 [Amanita phalloides]|nr:hypothetical protein APHAL10511_000489 [Amanita phalloides]
MSLAALPVELLSCVFTLSDDPHILACVCKHWLRVARNTPRLWTRICVTTLDMRHAVASLALSKKYPLDILIDARDDEWDFSEPEVTPIDPSSTHDPLLAPAIVRNALSLLLPHLHRWHSLTILTDTWMPMFLALNIINPAITTYGAPTLESLTLMRCNDFVSFSPAFRPRRLMLPAFLGRKGKQDHLDPVAMLPKLKHLHLTGVHLDWPALASAVERSQVGGLTSFSLGSHSVQVRPNSTDFARLLQASPALEALSVTGSGPVPLFSSTSPSPQKVRLDKLRKLVIGYRSLREASAVFDAISAPGVKEMVIEDVSHPADVYDVDGNDVLACLLSEQEVRQREEPQHTTPSPFLEVEELTLKNTKLGKRSVDQETLRPVLKGAKKLKRLVVEDIAVEVVLLSLFPDPAGCPPCPELESLVVKMGPACTSLLDDMPEMRAGVWFEMAKRVVQERPASAGLKQVKISLEHSQGTAVVVEKLETVLGNTCIAVEIEKAQSEEENEEGGEDDDLAYLSGGMFNEPVSDAYWRPGLGPLEHKHDKFGIVL